MESDLPLMELEEEDDSLIQPFPDPHQTPSKSSFNYFMCSPLALPPSRTKSLKDSVYTEKPSSSSSEASNNKENINSNNVEMPKLGMGPIQMKRRKKGAEFNLRKSLAWDRAFFTDEGILDPRELNLIAGINAYTCGKGLPTISEEGNSSFSSGRRGRNEPNAMEASKEALFKELRDKSRTPKGNKVGMHDSPHHKVTHKVLSTGCSNRAGSKVGGCTEPSPASSLKRPNSNTLRTAKKESKLPKLPMTKPGSCSSATTKSSMTARHNLIPKPPINVQKNVGFKSSLKDVHGAQSKAKTGLDNLRLSAKELAQKSVTNLTRTHPSSKATSSTKSQLVQIDRANSGIEMVPDRLQSCGIKEESASLATNSLAQHTPTTSVKTNSLPSGLKLPSPSLRFFDQTTASESVSLQQKRNQQSNTNMGSNKNGELSSSAASPRAPSGRCSAPSTLSTPCGSTQLSPSPNYMVNASKGVKDSTKYPDIVRKSVSRLDIKLQYECKGSDVESHKVIEQEKKIIGHEDKTEMEKIALMGDEEIKVSHLIEQNGEGINVSTQLFGNDERVHVVLETKDEFVLHNEEDKLQSYAATSVSTSGQPIQHQELNILTMVDGSVDFMQDLAQTYEGLSVNCIMPAVSSSLEEGQCGLIYSSAMLMEIPGKKEHGVDVGLILGQPLKEIQPELREVVSLIDDQNQSTLSEFRPEVQLINGTASVDDDALLKTESVLQVAQCARTYPQSLEEEGLDIAAATTEAEYKNNNEKQKHQDMGIIIGSLLTTTHRTGAEGSNISFGGEVEAEVEVLQEIKSPTMFRKRSNNIKGQDDSLFMHSPNAVPFSDEWLAANEAGGEDVVQTSRGQADTEKSDSPESHLDAGSVEAEERVSEVSVELHRDRIGKNEDVGATKCRGFDWEDYSVVLHHEKVGHENDTVKVVDENCLPMEDDVRCNTDTCSNYLSTMLMEVPSQKQEGVDVGLIPGQTLAEVKLKFRDVAPLVDDQDQSSLLQFRPEIELMNGTASMGDDVIFETDSESVLQSLEEEGPGIAPVPIFEDENIINEENQKHQEMRIIIGNMSDRSDVYECYAKPSNLIVPEQSIIHGCNLENSNVSTHFLSMVQGSVSDHKGVDKPNEPQDFVGIMPSMETNDYFTNRNSGYGLESSGQVPSESDSRFPVSQPMTTSDTTSITLCAVIPESGLVAEGAEGSKISFGGEVEAQALQEGANKNTTVLMKRPNNVKRQDKPLVIHPPNVVPFSDEWLATIEAPREDLAQTSREHANTKNSKVFVESQRGEIGKEDDDVGPATSSLSALLNSQFHSEGHSGKCIMPAESSLLQEGLCELATEMNDYIFQENNGNPNELGTSTHRIEAEGSKISFGEEDKAQVLQEGKNIDATVLMKRPNTIKRQDKSLVIHPPDAVPFSDEWLTAIEAAGEEILTMKCGAVQHSPPDKSIPERNPWSPVKNKANQIGPYDCTKYTNAMPSKHNSSD